jgi:hypothetical protein
VGLEEGELGQGGEVVLFFVGQLGAVRGRELPVRGNHDVGCPFRAYPVAIVLVVAVANSGEVRQTAKDVRISIL